MTKGAAKNKKKRRKNSKKRGAVEGQVAVEGIESEPSEEHEESDTAVAVAEEAEAAETTEAAPKEGKPDEEESIHAKYERIKKGDLYLTDLQKLTVAELHDLARKENIKEFSALKKQDLIFKILKERIRQNGLMYGEGVLEVLPDGYGFLRNPDYNYLSSPDDIYV